MTKLLTPQEYAEAARRTQKAQHWQAGIMEACFGLMGETSELFFASGKDIEAHKLESGDVLWYVALLVDRWNDYSSKHGGLPLDFAALMAHAWTPLKGDATDEAMAGAGQIADHVKKWVYHGKPIDGNAIGMQLVFILRALTSVANLFEFSLGEVMAANIAKLAARHPDGFDAAYHVNGAGAPISAED